MRKIIQLRLLSLGLFGIGMYLFIKESNLILFIGLVFILWSNNLENKTQENEEYKFECVDCGTEIGYQEAQCSDCRRQD